MTTYPSYFNEWRFCVRESKFVLTDVLYFAGPSKFCIVFSTCSFYWADLLHRPLCLDQGTESLNFSLEDSNYRSVVEHYEKVGCFPSSYDFMNLPMGIHIY